MRPSRSQRAAAVFVSVVLGLPPPAHAQEPAAPEPSPAPVEAEASEAAKAPAAPSESDLARAYFREGTRLFNAGRYPDAAAAFERSFTTAWSINAAYNAALSHEMARDPVAALRAYRRYLAEAAADDKDRAMAEASSEKLRAQVGEVQFQIDSAEAIKEIRINGVKVPLDAVPWVTLPGPLAVEFIGAAPEQRAAVRSDVRPGGTATIVFPGFVSPEPIVKPPPEPRPERPGPSPVANPQSLRRQSALRAAFWTSAGLAAASGAAVAVLGALALHYKGRREQPVCSGGVCPDDAAEQGAQKPALEAAALRYGTATNAMIGVTAAFGLAALALGIVALRERPRRGASTRARVRWVGPAVQLTF